MTYTLLFVTCGLLCVDICQTQPTICSSNKECQHGFYCSNYCVECIRCSDYNRESTINCARTIAECGKCLPGLTESRVGDVQEKCLLPGSVESNQDNEIGGEGHEKGLPLWLPVLLGILVVTFITIGIVLLCRYRLSHTVKVRTSTRASVQPRNGIDHSAHPDVEAGRGLSEEERMPPPPYNFTVSDYSPVRPTSPELPPNNNAIRQPIHDDVDESAQPFVKKFPSSLRHGQREEDRSQAARIFNNPNYIRSPEEPVSNTILDEDSNHPVQEETTTESPWRPDADTAENTPSLELSTLLNEARGQTLVRPPDLSTDIGETPRKIVCIREENNNGGVTYLPSTSNTFGANGRAGASDLSPRSSPPSDPTTLTLNISVQQLNDFKLIRT